MSVDRPRFGINIDLAGKGNPNLEVTVNGKRIKLDESAAPRDKDKRKPKYPEGTIESLMPLLRGVFSQTGETAPESFWLELDEKATMSPQEACAKLRTAGIGSLEAAEAMLSRDQRLSESIGFGKMTENDYQSLLASVASVVKENYDSKPPRRLR